MLTDRLSGIMDHLPLGLTALLGLFLLVIGLWQGAMGILILYLTARLIDRY